MNELQQKEKLMIEPLYSKTHWYAGGAQTLPVYSREVVEEWKEETRELLNKIAAGEYAAEERCGVAYDHFSALGPDDEECGTQGCFYVEERDSMGNIHHVYESDLEDEFCELAAELVEASWLSKTEVVELGYEEEQAETLAIGLN